MLGIPLALAYSNFGEWLIHKHVLHGKRLGKKKTAPFAFHFFEHHQASRRNDMIDADYRRSPFRMNAQGKEALGLLALAAVHAPLLPVAPLFTVTFQWTLWRYYVVHKKAHLDPAWAREHVPWHYDHHMGPDQDANWCVTKPWFDELVGTRKPYAGTERERADVARREARAAAA